ncbi:MAG: divergent polysaccharide deacetylase family protein [Rhodospirillales bacterium]|nr:divergent polysaccharide deacetylase family protein [Rhodospirillales bacterium]
MQGLRSLWSMMNVGMMDFMKRYANPRGTFLFIVIATALMFVIHFMISGEGDEGLSSYDDAPAQFKTALGYSNPPVQSLELEESDLGEIIAAYNAEETPEEEAFVEEIYTDAPQPKIEKVAPDYEPLIVTGKPKIAIIIDDMGVNRANSFEVIDIDAPLTLAFLPYAEDLDGITAKAKMRRHEMMIHMPMQAMSDPVSLGPVAIKSGMDEQAVKENMAAAFESFDGYVGVNNHMGSRVTQDAQLMDWVMEALGERGLYFIDSKTIGASVAADASRRNGLPTAVRDVFLDHEETPEFVEAALRKTEEIAAKKGYAIAIGHPKDVTIAGLQGWVDDVRARGFEIVRAGELVERPKGQIVAAVEPASALAPAPAPAPEKRKVVAVAEPQVLAKAEPAAGVAAAPPKIEKPGVKAPAKRDVPESDPNSAQAREAILKKMLGQAE